MSTVTKAANAHTVVATGWTNPSNCYSTTTDSTFATIATAKNSTLSGDFGFPAFTTSDIPDNSTITSVVFFTTYGMTAATTGALVGLQARRNSSGTTLGSEITRSTASMADANGTATGCTLTDLRTANELRVRGRGTKGNSSTASTAQIDRLYVTVTYTAPELHSGSFGATGGGVEATGAAKGATGTVTATGGGVSITAGSPGKTLGLGVTGGGVLTWSYAVASVENHDGLFAATGAGIVSTSSTAAHNGTFAATGGGLDTTSAAGGRSGMFSAVGAGIGAVGVSTDRSASLTVTGGGRVSPAVLAGRQFATALSGGGIIASDQSTARFADFAGTGGGLADVSGTQGESHDGSIQATGSGALAVTTLAERLAQIVATGSGVWTLGLEGEHNGAFHDTGGGRAAFGYAGPLDDLPDITFATPHVDLTVRTSRVDLEVNP